MALEIATCNLSCLFVSCKVCSSPFSDPRLLPCLHVFCKSCLDPLYSQNEEGTLACPICYKINTCPSPAHLPRHLRIEREVTQSKLHQSGEDSRDRICQSCDDKKKAEAYCRDCECLICSDCKNAHKALRITKNHLIIELDRVSQEPVSSTSVHCSVPCILHPNECVKYYCSSCSCLVCNECLFSHKEHHCDRIINEDLVKKEKDELQALLTCVEEAIHPLTKSIETISSLVMGTQTNKDRTVEEINLVFKHISRVVEKRRLELLKEISETAVAKSTQLEMQKEGLEKLSAGLQLALEAGNVAINDCSDVEVLAVKGSIVRASNEFLQENRSTSCYPVCGSGLCVAIDYDEVLESISHLGNVLIRNISPSTSSLVDCPQTIVVDKSSECSVTLQTRDSKGNELTVSGAIVTGTLTDTSGSQSEVHQCGVKDLENGQYEIMFNIPREGQFLLHVSVDNTIIGDSPVTVNVRDYSTIKYPSTTITTQESPSYVDIGPDGLRYITFNNGSIAVYNNNGTVVQTISQSQLGCGDELRGIAVGDNIMFIADNGNNQIIRASLDGEVIARVGSKGSGELEFQQPMGLCLTRDNLLLLADCYNNRVQVLGSDLSFIRSIPCLSSVWGVAVDGTGNIHAAASDGVEVFSITGEKITEYGQGVQTSTYDDIAFLYGSKNPYSFVTDGTSGSVHVFDWSNNTVVNSISCGADPLGITLSYGSIVVCGWSSKKMFIL